ncbi:cAMP-specific 3, 5 -cyclic phosphodiesterase 4C [Raphidocelis subcapitata]|uniref:Phosphodiesterase n=1 Tax=Raphidocelis subcapitata TaxID=307507 RepID=A0A2V0P8J5_9CHLO|nr:cAMP-specific 3, 5 -cyclic phosphodiesterase 4C [Raphidocelis subcapitata]|eukprot:GBF93405.1 cAMP-specific 3, 5 -cyclic phosphodiesterase 4C [Raphidocelis subcapitata]
MSGSRAHGEPARGEHIDLPTLTAASMALERLQAQPGALLPSERLPVLRLSSFLAALAPELAAAAAAAATATAAASAAAAAPAGPGGQPAPPPRDEARLRAELDKLDSWEEFDAFALSAASGGRPLEAATLEAVSRLGLFEALELPLGPLAAFLRAIEGLYRATNPYHHSTHAADVGTYALLQPDGLAASLTSLEALAAVVAAVVHDVDHRGLSNDFLVRTQHHLALTYNDASPNEQHSLSLAFRVLMQPGCNFLQHLPAEDFATFRALVLDIVRATDMVEHSRLSEALTRDVRELGPDLASWDAVARGHALAAVVHAADISNVTRPWRAAVRWGSLVSAEFQLQGDAELRLGLTPGPQFDRRHADAPRSQLAFIRRYGRPTFEALSAVAPAGCAAALRGCDENEARWAALEARGEKAFPL